MKFKVKVVYEFEIEASYEDYELEGEEANIDNLKEAVEENVADNPIEDFDCGCPEITIEEVK